MSLVVAGRRRASKKQTGPQCHWPDPDASERMKGLVRSIARNFFMFYKHKPADETSESFWRQVCDSLAQNCEGDLECFGPDSVYDAENESPGQFEVLEKKLFTMIFAFRHHEIKQHVDENRVHDDTQMVPHTNPQQVPPTIPKEGWDFRNKVLNMVNDNCSLNAGLAVLVFIFFMSWFASWILQTVPALMGAGWMESDCSGSYGHNFPEQHKEWFEKRQKVWDKMSPEQQNLPDFFHFKCRELIFITFSRIATIAMNALAAYAVWLINIQFMNYIQRITEWKGNFIMPYCGAFAKFLAFCVSYGLFLAIITLFALQFLLNKTAEDAGMLMKQSVRATADTVGTIVSETASGAMGAIGGGFSWFTGGYFDKVSSPATSPTAACLPCKCDGGGDAGQTKAIGASGSSGPSNSSEVSK